MKVPYNKCPYCRSNLDPGEKCECQGEHASYADGTEKSTAVLLTENSQAAQPI